MRMKIGGALLCQRTLLSGSGSGSTRRLAHLQFRAHSRKFPLSLEPPMHLRRIYRVAPAAIKHEPIGSSQLCRKDRIASRVIDLLLPVSGREHSEISISATFMEQGFDSLSLTQAAFAIGKEFSVKISFSQLMNQFPNIEMLAQHLDSTLPVGRSCRSPARFRPIIMALKTSPRQSTL